MNTAFKLVLAFVLLAALAGVAAILWLKPADLSHALELEKPEALPLEKARDASVEKTDGLADESAGSERASMPKEGKAAPAAKPAALEEEVEVVAHIVDERLRPIANAWLRPEDESAAAGRAWREARAGSDGVVKLVWKGRLHNYPVRFVAGADGYGSVFPRGILKSGETLHLGDLTLQLGGAVRGRVLDKEQRPVAKAEVVVSSEHEVWGSNDLEQLKNRGPSTWLGAPRAKSAEDGSFLVEGVPAGMTRAWARAEGSRWAVSEPLEVAAGSEVRDVVLVLAGEAEADPELRDIEGIVVGPDDKPVAKARMQVRQHLGNTSWNGGQYAEKDGRFRVHPRERGVQIFIEFADPQERYTEVTLADVKPGTKDLVVRLQEARTILVSVRDEQGPVEDFRVRWAMNEWDVRGFLDKAEPHADGRATVRVPTEAAFMFEVLAPRHVTERLGLLEGRQQPAELAVKLKTIPGIHGRVLAGENPVAGAKVALFEQPQHAHIEMNGYTTLVQVSPETETTSDSEGRFTLDLQRDGHFSVFVDAEGYARAQHGPLRLEAQAGLQGLAIQLDGGGVLEGKVLMPPGRSPAGVIVGINRGDAKPQTKVAGPDGAFRFERLTAGAWEIQRCEEMFRSASSTSVSSDDEMQARDIRHDFTIAVGETTRMDLDLRDADPCVLEIELTHNGQPARAWSIVAWPKGRHTYTGSPPSAATDSSGRARLSIEDPGDCTLTITPPAEAGSSFSFGSEVALQRGPNHWAKELSTGRLEGTIAGWQPDAGVQWRLGSDGAPSFEEQNRLAPDATGRFVVPILAAGKHDVLRSRATDQGQAWEKVQGFEVAAGQTKTLLLP